MLKKKTQTMNGTVKVEEILDDLGCKKKCTL